MRTKQKIMVFRIGGFMDRHDFCFDFFNFFYDDARLEVVNKYRCLRFNLTTNLSCKHGTDYFAAKGKKRVICLRKTLKNTRNFLQNI